MNTIRFKNTNTNLRFCQLCGRFALITVLFCCVFGVKGQTTGLYFIANNNTNAFDPSNPTNNWYLVPASDGGETGITIDRWTWNDDEDTPLVTTYQTQKDDNSVWAIVKVDNQNYFYLIHVLTGKYMTYNTGVGTNGNRRTFHMETNDTPGNTAQFTFTSSGNPTFYSVNPRNVTSGNMYMNPSNGNKPKYYAAETQDPTGSGTWVGGTIGLYNKNASGDAGSKWFLETSSLLNDLTINYNSLEGSYTITWHGLTVSGLPNGYVIRYTDDGSDPVTSATAQNYDGSTIVVGTDNTTVKAVLIGHHDMQLTEVVTQVVNTATPEAPTFEVTCDSKLKINCNISTATIYYNYTTNGTDPTDPDNTCTAYTEPVNMADNTKIKAIAYNGTNPTPSPVSAVYTFMNNTTSPTFVLTETTVTINHDHMANVTLHYTTDGSDPTDPDGTAQTYTGNNPLVISSLDYTHDVNILVYADSTGRGASCPVTVIKRPKQPTINAESECYGTTRIHTLTFTGTEEGKTYWYALSNGQNQPTPALNTFTEYTPGEEIDIAAIPTWNGTDVWVTLHAYAKTEDGYESHVVWENYMLKYTDAPSISHTGNTVTITAVAGATIHYTDNGGAIQTYSNPFIVTDGYTHIIRATAQYGNEGESCEANMIIRLPLTITTLQELMDIELDRAYDLGADIEITDAFNTFGTFTGSLNGNYYTISNLGKPLFSKIDGGTVNNLVLDNVGINGSGNVGAICNEADGATKIYNCGILSGSVSGGTNTGGLVGLVKAGSSVRVVNCYNYANVSGGTYAAGIVGKNEGTVSSDGTVGNVRIALCMMYGNVTGATNISPVYGGNHVNNKKKYTEYNYWRYRSGMQYNAYNDQMAIEKDDYLTRFPFYRHILNSHRELAAYFLFGGVTCNDMSEITQDNIAEIGHWAVKKGLALYPIIEPWPYNTTTTPTSTHNNLPSTTEDYAGKLLTNMGTGGYLSVSVIIGSNTYSVSLPITDMDTLNYDFTWGKVVLPFANEFEVNTDYSKVCTGWKITGITGGTVGSFDNYNVSDRNCTTKDLYSTTGFIFAQGGYYIVPYNVTAIEITANFATAYYLCDESYEIAYEKDGTIVPPQTSSPPSGYMNRTTLAGSTPNSFTVGQNVYTIYHALDAVLDAMSASGTTHAQAIVLLGNYHLDDFDLTKFSRTSKGYTIMSIDADNNQEPDYAIYSNNTMDRPAIPPTRYDFVAFIPMGMSSHVTGALFYPNTPIWKPRGWFEITETGLMWANQFEIESNNFINSDVRNYRCIINGGYFTQMVRSRRNPCTKLRYYQIGGKAYVKEFYPGNHSQNNHANTLVPVNVTGGEIEQCFMTGYGQGTAYGPNIYFWCAGGRIHKFLAAYMEPPVQTSSNDGSDPGTVNLTAKIDHARIYRFFGGGTSSKARITGNIKVTIDNSFIDFYCGGPEFGDMEANKTVTTTATNTTFREYYGAGFGGTATTYTNDEDLNMNIGDYVSNNIVSYPAGFFGSHYLDPATNVGRLDYKTDYGIGNCYKFEFIMHSRGHQVVARFYTGYAMFSLAKTGSVTNTLTNCIVERNFYGGGCQGTVDGTVNSTLTGCTIFQSAFGGGYKAESNEVVVYPTTPVSPLSTYNCVSSVFSDFGDFPTPDTCKWIQGTPEHNNEADETNHILYTGTNVTMSDLGNVTDAITITLDGNTVVHGDVFGGGHESKALSSATVTITGTSEVKRNVFGGGNMASVGINDNGTPGNTTVKLQQGATILGNVYGGGNEGPVGGDSKVIIEDEP